LITASQEGEKIHPWGKGPHGKRGMVERVGEKFSLRSDGKAGPMPEK